MIGTLVEVHQGPISLNTAALWRGRNHPNRHG
jgi:hypothetical protein